MLVILSRLSTSAPMIMTTSSQMYMYARMYVFMHVCLHVCMNVCTYVYLEIRKPASAKPLSLKNLSYIL